MKYCSKCYQQKEFSEYSRNRITKDGYYAHCKSCTRYRRKYGEFPDLGSNRNLYGLTPEQVDGLSDGHRYTMQRLDGLYYQYYFIIGFEDMYLLADSEALDSFFNKCRTLNLPKRHCKRLTIR